MKTSGSTFIKINIIYFFIIIIIYFCILSECVNYEQKYAHCRIVTSQIHINIFCISTQTMSNFQTGKSGCISWSKSLLSWHLQHHIVPSLKRLLLKNLWSPAGRMSPQQMACLWWRGLRHLSLRNIKVIVLRNCLNRGWQAAHLRQLGCRV